MSSDSKFKHDMRNCLISLETIALNLNDGLYEDKQAVESLLSLKTQFEELLEKKWDLDNDEK